MDDEQALATMSGAEVPRLCDLLDTPRRCEPQAWATYGRLI